MPSFSTNMDGLMRKILPEGKLAPVTSPPGSNHHQDSCTSLQRKPPDSRLPSAFTFPHGNQPIFPWMPAYRVTAALRFGKQVTRATPFSLTLTPAENDHCLCVFHLINVEESVRLRIGASTTITGCLESLELFDQVKFYLYGLQITTKVISRQFACRAGLGQTPRAAPDSPKQTFFAWNRMKMKKIVSIILKPASVLWSFAPHPQPCFSETCMQLRLQTAAGYCCPVLNKLKHETWGWTIDGDALSWNLTGFWWQNVSRYLWICI